MAFFVVEKADSKTSAAPAGTFTDVAAGVYCFDAVQWAVAQKITTGVTATTFAPGETCTKAQILTFLWRANGQPEPTAANPFTDVTQNNYYYKAVLWAAEQGLVSGSAFGASAPCTRAMTVEYLWTLAGKPESEKSTAFTDVPADAAYSKAVEWAVEKGVTTGKAADTFAPDAVCTRGQIATFLHRVMG
ncbi:S-layer homology domain-containing protein [Oscillibacter sp.]|uniref:S-layer homology domain-containing protein n=1 Tax=Oscillibacter sp. TaxID=1945593 RepID=UPI00289CB2B1|nr:S-layer homology domain-containing protein [Oscillibacter sp.]